MEKNHNNCEQKLSKTVDVKEFSFVKNGSEKFLSYIIHTIDNRKLVNYLKFLNKIFFTKCFLKI